MFSDTLPRPGYTCQLPLLCPHTCSDNTFGYHPPLALELALRTALVEAYGNCHHLQHRLLFVVWFSKISVRPSDIVMSVLFSFN